MISRTVLAHRPVLLVLAGVLPLLACLVLAGLRAEVANAPAVLVLVLLVVAAASTGDRAAGVLAAASAAVWFDVLLTRPYGQLAIHGREDAEAMVLLMVVGAAVTELSLWGRRQQARASRASGFLDGLVVSAESAQAADRSVEDLVSDVAQRITDVLGLDRCRFVAGPPAAGLPRLSRTGGLLGRGSSYDIDRDGLPVDTEVAVEVAAQDEVLGAFLLTAASRVTRPSRDQRCTAVLLADQTVPALLEQRRPAPPQRP
ncbi:DUF4118 domain-containing protein [Pedococcus sp. KACC 23699]|uniref:DUF4118 domain-containing protein n=1 Tax=Pedococcus sp. KACC 23699 TaxID=3149228 RepID=A0AAU7JS55_9MICO